MKAIQHYVCVVLFFSLVEFKTAQAVEYDQDQLNKQILEAAKEGNIKKIKKALRRGGDPNAQDSNGMTSLHILLDLGHKKGLRLLLKRGANPNITNDDGMTPLHIAASKNNTKAIKALFKSGADLMARDDNNITPIQMAVWNNHIKATTLLLDFLIPTLDSVLDIDELTLMHTASAHIHIHVINVLLANGALINAINDQGLTPLHIATWKGHTAVVKRLLKAGALANIQTITGITPLHLATINGSATLTKLLLDYDAVVDAQYKTGITPFHTAILSVYDSNMKDILQTFQWLLDTEICRKQYNACFKFIYEANEYNLLKHSIFLYDFLCIKLSSTSHIIDTETIITNIQNLLEIIWRSEHLITEISELPLENDTSEIDVKKLKQDITPIINNIEIQAFIKKSNVHYPYEASVITNVIAVIKLIESYIAFWANQHAKKSAMSAIEATQTLSPSPSPMDSHVPHISDDLEFLLGYTISHAESINAFWADINHSYLY